MTNKNGDTSHISGLGKQRHLRETQAVAKQVNDTQAVAVAGSPARNALFRDKWPILSTFVISLQSCTNFELEDEITLPRIIYIIVWPRLQRIAPH